MESSDPKVGLKYEVKSVASKKKTNNVDQEPETPTTSKSTSDGRNSASQTSAQNIAETERPSKKQSDRETDKEKKEKIRNKDRPTIQIYRPGTKRLITTKTSVL